MTRSSCLVAFDVDGTLVNTRGLVAEAYRAVGVNPPDHAWGLRWQDWLPAAVGGYDKAQRVHTEKTQAYVKLVASRDLTDRLLPAARVARAVLDTKGCSVGCITAGTFTTARMILDRIDLPVPLVGQVSLDVRVDALRGSLDAFQRVIYVDDNVENVLRIQQALPTVHTVHYVQQTYDELYAELYEEIYATPGRRRSRRR
jgi:phosphoglycolate phosphatase-like HAD superfamily hydrolase